MALTLASQISTALATGSIQVCDLWQINCGHGKIYRWSDRDVPASVTFDGQAYTGCVEPVDELPFDPLSDDSVTLRVDNTNGRVNAILQKHRLLQAKIAYCRLFHNLDPPNNAVGSWTAPYWQGTVQDYELSEKYAELEISSGWFMLDRRALDVWKHSCINLFADGLWCGYSPLDGRGLPVKKYTGTATSNSTTQLVDTAANFKPGDGNDVKPGWLIFNVTDQSIGVVTTVNSATTLTFDSLRNGTDNDFDSSDSYIVGPVFTTCPNGKAGCIERGMFGPNDQQVSADLNISKGRWFRGYAEPSRSPFWARGIGPSGKEGRFQYLSIGNDSLDGQPIPILYGRFKNRKMQLLGIAIHDETKERLFLETLWCFSARRCHNVDAFTVRVDDLLPDNVNMDANLSVATQGSCIIFGQDEVSTADDSDRVTSGELTTEQQKLGIAPRQSWSAYWRYGATDSYVSNPYLFNHKTSGDGVSWSGLCLVRVRTEPSPSPHIEPAASANGHGVNCRMLPGESSQVDDQNATSWTIWPNPVQVWYDYCRYRGIPDSALDLTEALVASLHCQSDVGSTQTKKSEVRGTISRGPADQPTSGIKPRWIWTQDPIDPTLNWTHITIMDDNNQWQISREVTQVYQEDIQSNEITPDGAADETTNTAVEYQIVVNPHFDSDKLPGQGDTFIMFSGPSFYASPRRYKFDGMLDKDISCGEMMQAILDNCNAKLTLNGGKLSPVIPTVVDLEDVRDNKTIFTDKGSNRNIIRRSGESTVKWKVDSIEDTPTAIDVEYSDGSNQRDYETTRLTVYNKVAQEYVAEAFGETKRRDEKNKTLSLNGTTSSDQALRLAALKIREKGPLPGNQPNGVLSFDVAIHDGQALQPWKDVHIVESDVIPAGIRRTGSFFRLIEKTDNPDKLTVSTKWRPHLNAFYDDTTVDMSMDQPPLETEFPVSGETMWFEIESVTSQGFPDDQGNWQEQAKVVITLPRIQR